MTYHLLAFHKIKESKTYRSIPAPVLAGTALSSLPVSGVVPPAAAPTVFIKFPRNLLPPSITSGSTSGAPPSTSCSRAWNPGCVSGLGSDIVDEEVEVMVSWEMVVRSREVDGCMGVVWDDEG